MGNVRFDSEFESDAVTPPEEEAVLLGSFQLSCEAQSATSPRFAISPRGVAGPRFFILGVR